MNLSFARRAICTGLILIGFSVLPHAFAQAQVSIENGVPVTIPVDAEMDNNFSVLVTDIHFGTLGITNGNGTATVTITTNGNISTQNNGDRARIVSKGDFSTHGILEISSALTNQAVHIRYSNIHDLTCDSCTGTPPKLIITQITDNAAAQTGLWSSSNANPDASATNGIVTTNNNGEAVVNIGMTLKTDGGSQPYPSGTYVGTFDVTLEY